MYITATQIESPPDLEVINIRSFGALGNGGTDDTTAIQSAINACAALGGGVVLIPPTTGGFVVSQLLLKDRVNLLGLGWRSVLKCKDNNTSASLITLDSTSVNYTRCAHFRIAGNFANQGANVTTAILLQGGTGNPEHEISRLFIQEMSGRGIDVQPGAIATRVYDNWIYDCKLEGIYIGAADGIVDRNIVGNSGLEGIHVAAFNTKTSNNKPFFSGQVTAARGVGIKVASTADNYMSVNDEPQDNLDDGWFIDSCDGACIMGGDPNNNAGSACHIKAGSYHRIEFHAGGGERTSQTSVVEFETSPANCFLDLSYTPLSIGSNPPIVGTVPSTVQLILNGIELGAGAATTREGLVMHGQGLKGENFSRYFMQAGTAAVSGTVYFQGIGLSIGDVITNIHVRIVTGGTSVTACKVGLYDTAGTRLALTADLGTSWQSGGMKTHALTAPYTVLTTGMYYLALFHTASTGAQPGRSTAAGGIYEAVSGSMLMGAQSGQSDLPSSATIANSGQLGFWVGWS